MEFSEGQIYKGNITISGGNNGPTKSWIVISPFNKTHIHSIDDPLDLHCWPLNAARKGLEGGYLELIKTDTQHPILHLQRAKEEQNINDIHMGLHGKHLDQMVDLLDHAVTTQKPYALYVAGEILAFMDRAVHSKKEITNIKKTLNKQLQRLKYPAIT